MPISQRTVMQAGYVACAMAVVGAFGATLYIDDLNDKSAQQANAQYAGQLEAAIAAGKGNVECSLHRIPIDTYAPHLYKVDARFKLEDLPTRGSVRAVMLENLHQGYCKLT